MQAQSLPAEGVVLLQSIVPPSQQEEVVAMLLSGSTVDLSSLSSSAYRNNPFLAFCQLFSLRWKVSEGQEKGSIPTFVEELSKEVHEKLYGESGIYPKEENGCSEDHQNRPCTCSDKTPQLPRSTMLNCVETLAYRADTQRGYHRDANWMVGLSFGCDVKMGFRRHDSDEATEVTIPSGHAVLFNGALHQHAVLGIVNNTAPNWWKYPFSRVVFLMRDSRQSFAAQKRKQKRQQAALEGGRQAASIAAAKFNLGGEEEESEEKINNYDILQ